MAVETAAGMQIRDRVVGLRRVRANELMPHPKNARQHPESQKNALRALMSQLGFAGAILAVERDGKYLVADGHLRTEEMGDKEVPVLVLDLNDEEVEMLLLSYDSIGAMAKVSKDRLDALLQSYDRQKVSFDANILNGLQADLEKMLKGLAKDAGSDWGKPTEAIQDEVPEPSTIPVTEAEDLWLLDTHRVLCGDSLLPETIDAVMGGKRGAITWTSPPYNAGVSAKLSGNTSIGDSFYVHDDDNKEQSNYVRFLMTAITQACRVSDYAFFNVQMLAGNKIALCRLMAWAEDSLCDIAIWDKGHVAPAAGQRVLDSTFEFVFIFSSTNSSRAIGTRDFRGMVQNVWRFPPQRQNDAANIHAVTMPVEFAAFVPSVFSNPGELVLDPFCGVGTTIIACQQVGRRCAAIDIEPAYVDVTVERWQKFTGQTAILESTGETFTQVKARRAEERERRAQPPESPPADTAATIPEPAKPKAKGKKRCR